MLTAATVTGTISGNNIGFSVTRSTPNDDIEIDYTGIVSGDATKGSLTVMGNHADWTVKRSTSGSSN